jgi:glycosyltransferase involved in cell wall biosynthesis
MPAISICLITYNREKYLKEAIDSILSQSFSDWELVIIDNGSTDNSVNGIIKSYVSKDSRIKLFLNNDNRVAYSRNLALSKCSGKYIAILDSDDVWCDNQKLIKQYEFLENNPDYVLVGGQGIKINEFGVRAGMIDNLLVDEQIRRKMFFYNSFIHSSVMYSREKALFCGGYEEIKALDDYALWVKLGLLGKVTNLPFYIVKYRCHSGNMDNTISSFKIYFDSIKIIYKYRNKYPKYLYNIIKLIYLSFKSIIYTNKF